MNNDQHNKKQCEYYRSADQATIKPVETAYVLRHIEQLITCGDLKSSDKILEVGAGIGRFSSLLQARGLDVTASDISPELIASLKNHAPQIPAFVADVNELSSHHDKRYDAVIGFFMLHHLSDLRRAFQSMSAMLKPGGKLFFCEPNAWFFPFYLQILLTPGMRWSVDKGVMNMRRGVLSPALKDSGFNHIEYTGYGYLPPQLYNSKLGQLLDHGLDHLPLPAQTNAFQIITASYE